MRARTESVDEEKQKVEDKDKQHAQIKAAEDVDREKEKEKDQMLAKLRRALDQALSENVKLKDRLDRLRKEMAAAKLMHKDTDSSSTTLMLTYGIPLVMTCVSAYFYAKSASS